MAYATPCAPATHVSVLAAAQPYNRTNVPHVNARTRQFQVDVECHVALKHLEPMFVAHATGLAHPQYDLKYPAVVQLKLDCVLTAHE